MPYTIQYESEGYIQLVYEGSPKIEELKAILARGAVLAQDHDCYRVLSDFRGMDLHITIPSLYTIAEIQSDFSTEMNMPYYKFKRAVVVPTQNYTLFKFFETVAVNRMHNVRIFTEYAVGLHWLFEN